jgi:hypothetical protein
VLILLWNRQIARKQKGNNMQFTVRADEQQTRQTEKGEWKVRRLTLLGSGQELTEQFVELDLPDSHPPVGVGKQIEVRVRKVLSVFMGNARIMGDIIESKKM